MELTEKLADLKALRFDRKGRYREWKDYMIKYNCQTVCELGVRQGFNFGFMVEQQPKLGVAVDVWLDDGTIGTNDACYDQSGLDAQYERVKNWAKDKPFIQIVRKYTTEAVKDFPDEFFDFIFIDANHTYEGISQDLVDWWPKVKPGGVFSGHDYLVTRKKARNGTIIKFGVVRAVDEFVAKNNLADRFAVLQPNPSWVIVK